MSTHIEAMKLAQAWFERNTYGDEAVEEYEALVQAITEAEQAQPVAFKPFEIETTIEEGGEIHQTITDVAGKVLLHVMNTQEDGVRSALIEMGWTPPRPVAEPHKPLTDEQKDARRWRYMRQKHADWFELSARAKDIDFDGGLDEAVDEAIAAHGIKGEA